MMKCCIYNGISSGSSLRFAKVHVLGSLHGVQNFKMFKGFQCVISRGHISKNDNLKLIFIKLYDSQTVFMIKTLGVMIKTDMFFLGVL